MIPMKYVENCNSFTHVLNIRFNSHGNFIEIYRNQCRTRDQNLRVTSFIPCSYEEHKALLAGMSPKRTIIDPIEISVCMVSPDILNL